MKRRSAINQRTGISPYAKYQKKPFVYSFYSRFPNLRRPNSGDKVGVSSFGFLQREEDLEESERL